MKLNTLLEESLNKMENYQKLIILAGDFNSIINEKSRDAGTKQHLKQ